MIGNDVVDLRDPDARPETFRPRFDERVFSLDERRAIAHDAVPIARRWAHWGAKEAAYKLAKQIDSTFVFSPARLVANFTSHEGGSNRAGGGLERRGHLELPPMSSGPSGNGIMTLDLRSFETFEQVHVVAAPAGSDWGAIDVAVREIDPLTEDPSAAVRAMAIRETSRTLGVTEERLTIGRDGRIPTVGFDGLRTSLCLSLSHHGRWISYAMRLPIDVQHQSCGADARIDSVGLTTGLAWAE